MKEITLTQGYKTVVDNEDYEELSKHSWHVSLPKLTVGRRDKKRSSILIHRVIMNAPDHLEVDHINGDALNNQRSNLRLCTRAENSRNRKPQQGRSSVYKGVSWSKRRQKWYSNIKFEGQAYNLGCYKDENQAALFYDIAAVHFFGEFARLNFPEHIEFIKNYWKEKEEVKTNVY